MHAVLRFPESNVEHGLFHAELMQFAVYTDPELIRRGFAKLGQFPGGCAVFFDYVAAFFGKLCAKLVRAGELFKLLRRFIAELKYGFERAAVFAL